MSKVQYDKSILNEIIDYLSENLMIDLTGTKLVTKLLESGTSYSASTVFIGVRTFNLHLVERSVKHVTHEEINKAMEILSYKDMSYDPAQHYLRIFELSIEHGCDDEEAISRALENMREVES